MSQTTCEKPETIGKYAIERRLGAGGMGEVWLGRHPDLAIPVAIKTLASHLIERDPQFVARFLQEARTAVLLNHPNIVRVFDAGSEAGVHYLVMEFVDGGTVGELLERGDGKVPVAEALAIVLQVARGLEEAARLKVIHRDIKPDNILLAADGTPKLADLGLAKQIDGGDDGGLTGTGFSVGTPAYIAPEQARSFRSVDQRADIYSLGATLFHLATGSPPFTGDSPFDVMMKHVREAAPDPRSLDPALPAGVCDLIARTLAKEPADRPQSASDLVAELEALIAALPTQAASLAAGGDDDGPQTVILDATAARAIASQGVTRWQRSLAFAVDGLLVAVVAGMLQAQGPGFWVLWIIYATIAVGWRGRTVGKRLFGLEVVDRCGGRLGWRQSLLRGLAYLASLLPFGLGFVWGLWDREQKTFHDKLVGTAVISTRSR